MTQNRFYYICENFDKFVGKEVEFKSYIPSVDKYVTRKGILQEVGTDGNHGRFIIKQFNLELAIFYGHVTVLDDPKVTFKKDGTITVGECVGTWECHNIWKEQGGRRDASGNTAVHYVWHAFINGVELIDYSRAELKDLVLNNYQRNK